MSTFDIKESYNSNESQITKHTLNICNFSPLRGNVKKFSDLTNRMSETSPIKFSEQQSHAEAFHISRALEAQSQLSRSNQVPRQTTGRESKNKSSALLQLVLQPESFRNFLKEEPYLECQQKWIGKSLFQF